MVAMRGNIDRHMATRAIQSAKSKVESSTVDGRMRGAAEVKFLMLSYASSELKADVNIKDERNADPELDEEDKESVTEEDDTLVEAAAAFAGFIKRFVTGLSRMALISVCTLLSIMISQV